MDRRVSIADVVTKTGLGLNTVSSVINDIAREAQAHLEVTTQGVIYYIFPSNLNYVYLSNRLLNFLHVIWGRIFRMSPSFSESRLVLYCCFRSR